MAVILTSQGPQAAQDSHADHMRDWVGAVAVWTWADYVSEEFLQAATARAQDSQLARLPQASQATQKAAVHSALESSGSLLSVTGWTETVQAVSD